MTAVIGVINKTAVALAADSAVTITVGGQQKILNTANKIFTLSKYHPVGIMLYNNLEFMGIPWEILIKQFRQKQDRNSFGSLIEYREKFLEFLKDNLNLVSPEAHTIYIEIVLNSLFQYVKNNGVNIAQPNLVGKTLQEERTITLESIRQSFQITTLEIQTNPVLENFNNYTLEEFISGHSEVLERAYFKHFGNMGFSPEDKNIAFNIAFHYFRTSCFVFSNWTGLVFAGYGDDEIYPSYLTVRIAEDIQGTIRFFLVDRESVQVSDFNNSAILTGAQEDVMQTFIRGIHPVLKDSIRNIMSKILSGVNAMYSTAVEQTNISKPIQPLLDVSSTLNSFEEEMDKVQNEVFIQPVVASVATLSKDDLAEMAESLIHLTYLQRRASLAPESVGGPVDVAVISKTDGFIWIKRKLYFKPEINHSFFQNYFNSND